MMTRDESARRLDLGVGRRHPLRDRSGLELLIKVAERAVAVSICVNNKAGVAVKSAHAVKTAKRLTMLS